MRHCFPHAELGGLDERAIFPARLVDWLPWQTYIASYLKGLPNLAILAGEAIVHASSNRFLMIVAFSIALVLAVTAAAAPPEADGELTTVPRPSWARCRGGKLP